MRDQIKLAITVGFLATTSNAFAVQPTDRERLLELTPNKCTQTASSRYGVPIEKISVVGGKAPKYSRGLRGAVLLLEIGEGVGKKACIVRKSGKVSFSSNTNIS